MSKPDFRVGFNGKVMDLGERTFLMGILNVTPDSFYDGGRYNALDSALARAEEMVEEGADIIDVGGESSRPQAMPVSEEEEEKRVLPLIKKLAKRIKAPISIDTYKARVARHALDEGAWMVNDISALRMDKDMAGVVREKKVPLSLMHMQGTPQNMQDNPGYADVVKEIIEFLRERIEFCTHEGINPEQIIVDPGIGFGKTVEHNLEILKNLSRFKKLSRPLLVGVSRKSLVGKVLGVEPEERLEGSIALGLWSAEQGANILRVHDVLQTKRALKMIEEVKKIRSGKRTCE